MRHLIFIILAMFLILACSGMGTVKRNPIHVASFEDEPASGSSAQNGGDEDGGDEDGGDEDGGDEDGDEDGGDEDGGDEDGGDEDGGDGADVYELGNKVYVAKTCNACHKNAGDEIKDDPTVSVTDAATLKKEFKDTHSIAKIKLTDKELAALIKAVESL